MSCQKRNSECYDASNPAPKELRELVGLELRKRNSSRNWRSLNTSTGNWHVKSS